MTTVGLLFRRRDLGLLWTGGLVSMMGDWILWVALPLRVYELTGSALATAGLVASLVGPEILFGSFAGVLVDRWDRRKTMIAASLLQAAGLLPLLLVDSASTVWIAYPVMALSATLFTFAEPAENAFLPRLVPAEELVEANAVNALNNSLARLIGPALGGVLFLAGGLGMVAVVDALTFLVAAALVAAVRTSGAPEPHEDDGAAAEAGHALARMGREWVDGLRVIRRSRPVSVVLGVTAATAVGEGIFGVMFLIWVKRELEGGVPEYGWFMSGQAIGGLLGGLVAGWFVRKLSPARLFGVSLLVFGVLDLALFNYPLAVPGVALGLVLIVLVGIPGVASRSARQTLIQTDVPDRYRGRVFGALGTTAALLMFAATFVAGAVGETVGPIAMLNVQGLAYVVSGLAVLALLAARVAPLPEPGPQEA